MSDVDEHMKLRRLQLTKFKTFLQEQLEFAAITLLTGANSSGKTSVLQALCAIAQAQGSSGFPFDFRLNGPLVRLGDFQNVINGHRSKGSFGVGLDILDQDAMVSINGLYRKADEGGVVATRAIRLEDSQAFVEIAWNQKQQAYFLEYRRGAASQNPIFDVIGSGLGEIDVDWQGTVRQMLVHHVASGATSRARTTETVMQEALRSTDFDVQKIVDFWHQQEEELQKGKIKLTASTFIDAIAEVRKLPPVASAMNRTRRRVDRALRQVKYVGAVRALPLRYYAASTAVSGFDPYGEGVSLRLAQWKEGNRDRFNAVKDALVQLELATELSADTHLGEFVQVRVTPRDRRYTDTIADVGFGVSQVLPMVVADVGLGAEGTLLVNQPEVHLHPSSQALLGNYFASRIGSRQYVIETHSEYLITRLRILIAKKILRASDVNLYFMMPSPSSDGTLVRRIQIDDSGALVDAPKEFFRTYITDSYELALSSFPES